MDGLTAARLRLANQRLAGAGLTTPAATVGWLGAVQAQEYAMAKWSVGQRTAGAEDATVQRALDTGLLVRTHVLRPTWHFVAAADLAQLLRVTSPRVHALNAYYYRRHGLDAESDRVTFRALARALRGGNHLTRAELSAALAKAGAPAGLAAPDAPAGPAAGTPAGLAATGPPAGPAAAGTPAGLAAAGTPAGPAAAGTPAGLAAAGAPAVGNRLAYVLMRAELDGLVTSGVMRGRQQTYALAAERIPGHTMEPPSRPAEQHDADLAELTSRYFTSHGPATAKDFAWWSSLTLTQVRRGLALIGSELGSVEVAGQTLWYRPAPEPVASTGPAVRIIQGYDEYLVAYTESRRLANLTGRELPIANENTLVHGVVLDSQLIGLWRRAATRGAITVRPAIPEHLTARQFDAVEAEFARYSAFAGTPVTVMWP